MTEGNELHELMKAIVRLETKFDNIKEDVDELKNKNSWLARTIAAAIITTAVPAILTAIVVVGGLR